MLLLLLPSTALERNKRCGKQQRKVCVDRGGDNNIPRITEANINTSNQTPACVKSSHCPLQPLYDLTPAVVAENTQRYAFSFGECDGNLLIVVLQNHNNPLLTFDNWTKWLF